MTKEELNGLIGEVEDSDVYLMRRKENIVSINDPSYIHVQGHERPFTFEPDVIFDIGANVGVFTRYCRKLFPECRIVSVEPDDINAQTFLSYKYDDRVKFIKAAIGTGNNVYRFLGAVNGSGECYLSEGLGYDKIVASADIHNRPDIKSILLSDLVDENVKEGEKYIIKLDIEGAENFIFQHEPSIRALLNADYFTAELHYYANDSMQLEQVKQVTKEILKRFEETHKCWGDDIYFYAVKK